MAMLLFNKSAISFHILLDVVDSFLSLSKAKCLWICQYTVFKYFAGGIQAVRPVHVSSFTRPFITAWTSNLTRY